MSDAAEQPGVERPDPAQADGDADYRAILGPARLAYFSELTDYPILADRKAAFILTTAGLLVTVLLFFLETIAALLRGPNVVRGVVLSALLIGLLALLGVAARAAFASYVMLLPAMPRSLAFFRHIATVSLERYTADMMAMDHPAAVEAMLHYNYSVAVTAAAKFRLVGRGLRCMRVAIPLWMMVLLLLAVWR